MEKRHWGFLLRLAAGLSLAYLVIRKAGSAAVWEALTGVQPGWLVVAIGLVALSVVVSAHRWGLLLAVAGIRLPLCQLVRVYLIGLFANNFLPSSIGGDVVRLWATGRASGRTPEVAASVLVERITGGWGLSLAALAALAVEGESTRYALLAAGLLALAMTVLAVLLLMPGWVSLIAVWVDGRGWQRAASALRRGVEALTAYRQRPGSLLLSLLWAILFHLIVSGVNYALLLALSQRIAPLVCVGLTALAMAITVLPVSIGGLGVREAAYVQLFGLAAIPAEAALAASLLFLAAVSLVSLPGGILMFLGSTPLPKEESA